MQKEIDIWDLFRYLVSKWKILAAVCAVCAVVSLTVSALWTQPRYVASTRVYILNETEGDYADLSDIQSSTLLLNDYKALVMGENVAANVIEKLELSLLPEELAEKVQVKGLDNSRIVEISVTDADPYVAAGIANGLRDAATEQFCQMLKTDAVKLVYAAGIPQKAEDTHVLRNTVLAGLLGLAVTAAVLVFAFSWKARPVGENARKG